MSDPVQHAKGIIQCRSIYAGPCMCGPAVHINLGRRHGDIIATAILSPDECEGLIEQIKASVAAIRTHSPPLGAASEVK